MARTLTGPTAAAQASQITQPGYLIYIEWATPVFLSSRADLTWNGHLYVGYPVDVSGIEWRGSAEQGGTLRLSNADNVQSETALAEGVADIRIRVWVYDAAAVGANDPVEVFDGVGDGCDITPDSVTIKCVSKRTSSLFAPRNYINQDSGFSIVPPEGKTITWNGQKYVFTRKS